MDKSSKILKPTFLREYLFFLLLLVFLPGCSQKYVVYHPSEHIQESECFSLDLDIASFYQKWKGTPYLYGGESKKGIDCSAFMQKAYSFLYNKELPRTTREQVRQGDKVAVSQLKKGDLVFFSIGKGFYHVGMYLGNNRFLHAGESSGVTISSLSEQDSPAAKYWRKRYHEARRL